MTDTTTTTNNNNDGNFFSNLLQELASFFEEVFTDEKAPALQLAQEVILGAEAGTPWNSLLAIFLQKAEAQGISVAVTDAEVYLNATKAKLLSNGTVAPTVPAVLPAPAETASSGSGSATNA